MSIEWPKVILFGDSLTERAFEPENGLWGTLLIDRLQRVADVIPRGFSGYTSRVCHAILPHIFTKDNVKNTEVFMICLGANDSCDEDSFSRQYVPLKEFETHILDIIKYMESIGVPQQKVILMTPPPYCQEKYEAFCKEIGRAEPRKKNEAVGRYVDALVKIGQEHSIEVVNLYSEMMKDKNWSEYLVDGLHFSHSGSVKVYKMLMPFIEKRIACDKKFFPDWSEIDPYHPEESLKKIYPELFSK